jgi:hypothetical protein
LSFAQALEGHGFVVFEGVLAFAEVMVDPVAGVCESECHLGQSGEK